MKRRKFTYIYTNIIYILAKKKKSKGILRCPRLFLYHIKKSESF